MMILDAPAAGTVSAPAAEEPSGPRRYSLRTNLLALVSVCVLPVAAIAVLLVYGHYRLGQDRIVHDTVLQARHLAAEMDREVAGVISGLRVLATAPELARGDLAEFHARAVPAKQGPMIDHFRLTDREGRVLLDTRGPFREPVPGWSVAAAQRRSLLDDVAVVADFDVEPPTKGPTITVGVPVRVAGEFRYQLSAGVSPLSVTALITRRPLPQGWVAAVLDGRGTIIGRSRAAERFVGQRAVPAMIEQIAAGREGSIETVTVDGVQVISSFSKSSLSDWSVAIGAPRATLQRELMQLLGWVGAGLVVVVCAGLWMALRIARRVTGAVDGLNDAALALGAGRPVRLPRTQLVEADAVGAAILQASDILDHARHLAYHDALTGLCNRALFDEMLRRHVAASERHGTPLAVLLLDLDGFKSVNDRHGHAMGDAVLKSAAARIIGAVRAEDVAARLGGDEFGVLLFEADATQARLTAERMVALLSEPYAGADTPISASVGIAVWPHAGRTPAALLAGADRALYEAKRGGKRRASVAR